MRHWKRMLALTLALLLLTACGTSAGGAGGVGAVGATGDAGDSAPALTERAASDQRDYDRYFRNNTGLYVDTGNGLDESGWVIGEEFRTFDSLAASLTAAGKLPEPEGFDAPDIWARYDEAGHVQVVRVDWQTAGTDGYVDRTVSLYLWPQRPAEDDPYRAGFREGRCTVTEALGSTVTGAGTADTARYLHLELPDGACAQLYVNQNTATEDAGPVLDFLLEQGFDFSPYAYEAGEPLTVN